MMNTRQTFVFAAVATIAIACSQCTSPSTNTTSSNATSPIIREDAGTREDASGDSSLPDAVVDDVADLPVAEWLPIPGLEMCDGYSLTSPAAWPTRTWTSCGPGCLTAPAVHVPDAILAGADHSGAATILGETYVRTAMYTSTYKYHELRRMSDDAVLFVLRFRKGCLVSGGQNGSPFLFELFESGQVEDSTIEHSIGTFDLGDMKFHLDPGLVSTHPNIQGWLVWNDGWGVFNGGKVDVALNPAQSALTTIFQGGSPDYSRAHEDMIAWVDWGYWPTPIRRYTVKGGVKTLIQGDWGAVGLGIGDERIAWIKVTGFEASLGIYETAQLAWTSRTDDPANVQIVDGPSLTNKFTGSAYIGTVGDYIALTTPGHGGTGAPSGTYVLQVSTGKFWFIQAPTNTFVTLAALGTKEILVMTTSSKINPNYFENYLRYDLSKLDELGQLVAP